MAWPLSEVTTATGVMAVQTKQLHDGNVDGAVFGKSTDVLSFFGATPTTQPAAITVVSTQEWTSTAPFGPSSSTLAAAFVDAVDDIRAALKLLGLTA